MPTATETQHVTEGVPGREAKPGRQVEKKGEVHKVGNLTRQPELRYLPNGTAVVSTGLAVDRPKVPGNWAGERETMFYELTIFRDLAENAPASLTKGTRVLLVGNAELEHWTDNEGQARTTKRIIVNAIGPDVRWATVTVNRIERRGPGKTADEPSAGTSDEDF